MFVGYLHVRWLPACSLATCISVGYSTYMCQFSFNIKAPLFVCSSLALNLLTTRLVNLVKLACVLDLVFFLFLLILHPFRIPFHVRSALGRPCRTLAFRLSPASPLTFSKALFRHRRPCNRSIHRRIHFRWLLQSQLLPGLKTPEMTTPTRQLHPIPI